MSSFRKVSSQFWNDGKVRLLSDNAKLAFLALLTHPDRLTIGAINAGPDAIAARLSLNPEWFVPAVTELAEAGLIGIDGAGFVAIWNYLKHNPPDNPKQIRGFAKLRGELVECDTSAELCRRTNDAVRALIATKNWDVSIPFPDSIETVPEPYRYTDTDTDTDTDTPLTPHGGDAAVVVRPSAQLNAAGMPLPGFQELFDIWPSKHGKFKAQREYAQSLDELSAEHSDPAAYLLQRAQHRLRWLETLPADSGYRTKELGNWLSEKRYLDPIGSDESAVDRFDELREAIAPYLDHSLQDELGSSAPLLWRMDEEEFRTNHPELWKWAKKNRPELLTAIEPQSNRLTLLSEMEVA